MAAEITDRGTEKNDLLNHIFAVFIVFITLQQPISRRQAANFTPLGRP
jgi:hypothetical protein